MGRQTLGCKCCSSGIAAVWESPLSLDALSFSPVGASHPGGVSQHLRQSAQCGFGWSCCRGTKVTLLWTLMWGFLASQWRGALIVLNLLLRFVLNELVQTEKDYVKDLGIVVEVSTWLRTRLWSPSQGDIGPYLGPRVFSSPWVFTEMKLKMVVDRIQYVIFFLHFFFFTFSPWNTIGDLGGYRASNVAASWLDLNPFHLVLGNQAIVSKALHWYLTNVYISYIYVCTCAKSL